MHFKGNGLLLFVENYNECVAFYHDKLKLPIIFTEENVLTTFSFGGGYLMLEINGQASRNGKKELTTNPTVLRFDVDTANFDSTVELLKGHGISIEVASFDWGHTASFYDPDGNRCELYAPLINMPDNFTQR